jgi:hypothetical protein
MRNKLIVLMATVLLGLIGACSDVSFRTMVRQDSDGLKFYYSAFNLVFGAGNNAVELNPCVSILGSRTNIYIQVAQTRIYPIEVYNREKNLIETIYLINDTNVYRQADKSGLVFNFISGEKIELEAKTVETNIGENYIRFFSYFLVTKEQYVKIIDAGSVGMDLKNRGKVGLSLASIDKEVIDNMRSFYKQYVK